jgi:hypothetical protein
MLPQTEIGIYGDFRPAFSQSRGKFRIASCLTASEQAFCLKQEGAATLPGKQSFTP